MLPRVCIFGAGGVGGWLGARLAEGGAAEVVIIARGEHGAAIRERGLRLRVLDASSPADAAAKTNIKLVELPPGGVEAYESVTHALASGAKPVDFAILGVKTWQVHEAASAVEPLLMPGSDSCVVTTQNGVGAPGAARDAVGPSRVLGGTCKVNAYLAEPGLVEMAQHSATFEFGEVYDTTGNEVKGCVRSFRAERLAKVLSHCKGFAPASGVASVGAWTAIWDKAIAMCCLGPWGAVCRAPHNQLLGIPQTRRVLQQLMLEVAICGNVAGHLGQPEKAVEAVLARLDRLVQEAAPGITASTARDVILGSQSEIFELSGAMSSAGLSLGVPTPMHDIVLAALLPQEYRARGEKPYELQGVPGGAPHVAASMPQKDMPNVNQ